ncbi:hypothetical protein CesoFtcFv8_004390 [Champsocephalus esox]|uniref:Zinc finger PHD-type domain-containing protein n=1 Tax=Champsocephalus esox TaxID=159716 RepID=A0AAN8HCH4_9TELE|nr:hypothetical protein CesoFtcFv8_004390 [Champsocephalus esox]
MPVGLSLFSSTSSNFAPKKAVVPSQKVPPGLRSLYRGVEGFNSLDEVYSAATQTMKLDHKDVERIGNVTKLQSKSLVWNEQRAGRITSSVSHSVLRTSTTKPSPNAMLACSCHGMGVLEIKCPFKCREIGVEEMSKEKDSCLDQNLELKESPVLHANATSMCVTGASDFLVWLPTAGHVCTVFPDKEYTLTSGPVLTAFREGHIRPELLFRKVELGTEQSEHGNKQGHCSCGCADSVPMLGCDDDACTHQWFHWACVGITKEPRSKTWYCDNCKSSNTKRKRKGDGERFPLSVDL